MIKETASTSTLDLLRDDEQDEDEDFNGFPGEDFPPVFSFSDSEEFELDSGDSDHD